MSGQRRKRSDAGAKDNVEGKRWQIAKKASGVINGSSRAMDALHGVRLGFQSFSSDLLLAGGADAVGSFGELLHSDLHAFQL